MDIQAIVKKHPRLTIGWVLSLALLGYLWVTTPEGFWIEALFVIEIAVITAWTRSTTLRDGMVMFLLGIVAIAGGSLLLGSLMELFGANLRGIFWQSWFFSIVEELFKIAPAFLFMGFMKKKYMMRLNPSDLVWLVAASSAGFSVVEKYFWETVNFSFTYGPKIGDWYLFPDALGIRVSGEPHGYVGHAAASVFVALLFGIGMHIGRKKNDSHAPAMILGGLGFFWVTLEHILSNMYYGNGSDALLSIGGGQFTPWMVLIAAIVFVVMEVRHSNTSSSTMKFSEFWAAKMKALQELGKTPIKACEYSFLALKRYRLGQLRRWNESK